MNSISSGLMMFSHFLSNEERKLQSRRHLRRSFDFTKLFDLTVGALFGLFYLANTDWSLKTLARRAAQKRKFLSVLTERGKVLKSNHV